jgi:hypothetical protein
MSTGRRIDRGRWPDDRLRRAFFELLDEVHREHGAKSLGVIADAMHLPSPWRVRELLRGKLPVDERQVSALIEALGGSGEEIERGLTLYRTIRRSAVGEISGGSSVSALLAPYLLVLAHGGVATPRSAGQEFVEPEVQAHADRTTAGVLEILRAEPRLLLFGAPGAGKSTVIRELVCQMARAYMKSECPDLPVLVPASRLRPLGDIPWDMPGMSGGPWSWLAGAAQGISGLRLPRALQKALREGNAHVFVDGLDEIPDPHQRSLVADALDYMRRESPGLKICVSARPTVVSATGVLGQFRAWEILPFDDARAGRLLALLTGSRETEVRRQVAAAPQLGPLTGNPLMVRLLSLYTDQRGLELPPSRLQLFEDLADAMMAREQRAARRQISISALHRGHEIAAESMAARGVSALPVAELAVALKRDPGGAFSEEDSGLFLSIMLGRDGILAQASPGEVGFAHRTFQDFYLGRVLARDFTAIGRLASYDLSGPLSFAAGLAADPAPVIRTAYERYGVALAASCCKELGQGRDPGRRYLAGLVLDDLGPDFDEAVLGVLKEKPGAPGEAAQVHEEGPHAGLRQAWEAVPRKGAPTDSRGRGLEKFAVTLLSTCFEVIKVRSRLPVGEVDVIIENLNHSPFWANYPGDIWVECKNTEAKATIEQVNTFLGKLTGSRSNLGFFLSTAGFTKDAMDRMKIVASDRTSPLIAPVAGSDIDELLQQCTDPAVFFKSAIRKVA